MKAPKPVAGALLMFVLVALLVSGPLTQWWRVRQGSRTVAAVLEKAEAALEAGQPSRLVDLTQSGGRNARAHAERLIHQCGGQANVSTQVRDRMARTVFVGVRCTTDVRSEFSLHVVQVSGAGMDRWFLALGEGDGDRPNPPYEPLR